ncbi:hypothetical protein LOTGIDRAFT_165469 [Lottia gigantea]|uniref:WxxW domain-containing protein n=1 Tax=Lottia gigantea TaxID=225164 RepID=V3ZWB9_LOTGI|nr:hypothetical protein LOTGIDRAFT_165469 [Lottia gigantea]ESO88682.1 hypothetical protein LOTGIDRAFT_165469 [Lottia gigantea]
MVWWPVRCHSRFGSSVSWTLWYNTDEPSDGEDIETFIRIQKINNEVCKDGEPEDVECRVVGDEESTFVSQKLWKGNTLKLPCTKYGVTCLDVDQEHERKCFDYEIRFLCSHDEDARVTNSGAFIALSAGCSILIPLICVLIIKCRKSRLAQNQRNASATTPAQNCDPPPSYEQLFGGSDGTLTNTASSTEDLVGSSRDRSDGYINEGFVETISGTSVSDTVIETDANFSNNRAGPSRYPGMHVSVTDLMGSTCFQYDTTPPPTYNEALEILKSVPPKT